MTYYPYVVSQQINSLVAVATQNVGEKLPKNVYLAENIHETWKVVCDMNV